MGCSPFGFPLKLKGSLKIMDAAVSPKSGSGSGSGGGRSGVPGCLDLDYGYAPQSATSQVSKSFSALFFVRSLVV